MVGINRMVSDGIRLPVPFGTVWYITVFEGTKSRVV